MGQFRTAIGALAVISALSGGACAAEADDEVATGGGSGSGGPTSGYLAALTEQALDATYRYEVDVTIDTAATGRARTIAADAAVSGEVDGELSSMTVDPRDLVPEIAAAVPSGREIVMHTVSDGDHVYIAGSYFASLMDLAASRDRSEIMAAALGSLADLEDDEWGRVDLAGLTMAEIASTTGAQAADPALFLDIAARGTDVEDLGQEQVDGAETSRLSATATYEDMLLAQGVEPDEFRAGLADAAAGSDADIDEVYESTLSTEIALKIWVDDSDRVRRVDMEIDMVPMIEALGTGGDDTSLVIGMTMHVTDHDDASIAIDIPDESVDVTDDFLAFSDETSGEGTLLAGS